MGRLAGKFEVSDGGQWITAEVQLPQVLLDAHADGRVVFFVGAGASKAAPSSLPLFQELVCQLGDEAGEPYVTSKDGEAKEPLDHFLGRLTHLTPPFSVHERAHTVLARESSRPNAWHESIVRLASAHGNLRIVTTNFDDHLSTAASAVGVTIADKWIGPALPLGHSVEGLVHLHGSVTRGHDELVLTDKDLGQAYLSEAWASRFLLKLFEDNIVVFIGYALSDPTLRYLTLGLPSGASLFVFTRTSESTDPDWGRLGVTTIDFGEDFANVPRALSAWDVRARMGQMEHRARIETLIDGGTALTPVDRDYLIDRVGTVEGARDFVRAATRLSSDLDKIKWLAWAEPHPSFIEAFSPGQPSEVASILANWFLREFAASPELHGVAFQTLQRHGQRLADQVFERACIATWDLNMKDPVVANRWRAFLSTSVWGHSAPIPGDLILGTQPEATFRGSTVLRSVLRPHLRLTPRWSFGEEDASTALPNGEIAWNVEEHALTPYLMQAVADAPPGEVTLGGVLEEALASAYDLLHAYHGERAWDPLSHGRSAIEPHSQDNHRESLDALVDALREYGTKAVTVRSDIADLWWDREHSLFQRLALHVLAIDSSRPADEKLQWVLARTGLYPDDLKRELFHLLAAAIPKASDHMRERVLAGGLEGPDYRVDMEDRERHVSYAKYNLLVWLTTSIPDWGEAAEALASLQIENPDFGPREHPDFDMWMSVGTWGGRLPLAPEEFISLLTDDASAAVEVLLERDYTEVRLEEPTWEDALSLIRQVVGTRPDLGIPLWSELDRRGDIGDRAAALRRAIVAGWSAADLGENGEAAVKHVAALVGDPENAYDVGRFLLEQIGRQLESNETPMLAALRRLARSLWDTHSAQFSHNSSDLMSVSPLFLNSWPGFVAQYWTQEIDRRWRHHRDDWAGLSDQESAALVALLSGPRPALDATQPALARVLQFLFAADRHFTTEHVLPLFRAPETAVLVWHAYLHSPRWDDKLLAAGLLECIGEQWTRLEKLGDRSLRQQFFVLVIGILSWAGVDELARRALLTQSIISSNGSHAAGFAATVSRFMSEESVDSAQIWQRWLREHLTNRVNGVPRYASTEELNRWADAVPYLGDATPEAARLLAGRGIWFDDDWFDDDIPEATLRANGATLIAHFVERLGNTTTSSMMLDYRLRELIASSRKVLGDDVVQPLIDAARERDIADVESD